MPERAVIVLEDGTTFGGEAFAGRGTAGGEFVFTTSMQGYQETATDPSYAGQVLAFTFPMIGNYGTDPGRDESARVHARAIVARELTDHRCGGSGAASWREWLAEHGVLAVSGVDTRALTRRLREHGALRGVVSTDGDVRSLGVAARSLPAMAGLDLATAVTCSRSFEVPAEGPERFHVVALDYGVKRSMLRLLARHGMRVTVVPAATSAAETLALRPDGVLLSNGPGDPAAVTYAVATVRDLLGRVPVFGICLGHQLLALGLGWRTYKLKFGHRGANHPVRDLATGRVEITAQNHGFAVADDGAGHEGAVVSHVNLNDGTVEGIAAPGLCAFSVQFHPESSPGPHDSLGLFERFAAEMRRFGAHP
jgi:carbamoyl-phosphate synthase small subunit